MSVPRFYKSVLIFSLLCCCATVRAQTSFNEPSKVSIPMADNEFGVKLLQRIDGASPSDRNVFLSPVSITQALGMVYVGSAGPTHREIGEALNASADYEADNLLFLSSLSSPDHSVQLTIANAIWGQSGRPFSVGYSSATAKYFNADAKSVDFADAPDAAMTINDWVDANTNGKISQLVSPAAVADAKLVITDAVYFRGTWANAFDTRLTAPLPFTLNDGTYIQIPTMHRDGMVALYEDASVSVIELPYAGTPALSMVIALPAAGVSVNSVVQSLTPDEVEGWVAQAKPTSISLYLPKFHIDYSDDLSSALESLGIRTAFTRAADFSPAGIPDIHVTSVVHKATLDVDEQGTVATAATGVIIKALAMPIPNAIHVDHPFVCAVRDNQSGALLFLGVVNHPD